MREILHQVLAHAVKRIWSTKLLWIRSRHAIAAVQPVVAQRKNFT